MRNFAFPASLVEGHEGSVVTAYNASSATPLYTADDKHPKWEQILDGLEAGDPAVWDLFNLADAMVRDFRSVSERVSYDGSNILWDGDPIHSVLAEQVMRAVEDGHPDNAVALARFWEKLESNPNAHSREQAYNWLASHKFQITADGDLVGYKGVRRDGDGYKSTATSQVAGKPSGYVNGKAQPPLSTISQRVFDEVTMPRSEVEHDPAKTCSRGLHVGDHSYGSQYGNVTLEVIVNPRDIVSVPTDAGGRKVRVCRYVISREVSTTFKPATGPVLRDDEVVSSWVPNAGYRG